MKKGYSALALSLLAILVPIYLFYTVLMYKGYKPLLTNSISFDEKIRFIQNKKITQTNLLAIGSSMTLNNLSSRVIMDSIKSSYFNFACWGLQIGDTKKLLINYLPKYKPKCVVICSSVLDFADSKNITIDRYSNTWSFFKDHQAQLFYMRNYNSIQNIKARKDKSDTLKLISSDYNSLKFDEGGGVLLNIPKNKISQRRWNLKVVFPTKATNYQYHELVLICMLLHQQHISLVFIQPPIKRSYTNSLRSLRIINAHFLKCKTIVEKYGGAYLSMYGDKEFSDDKMFVDQFHLSETGATLFTQKIVRDLKKVIH